MQIALFKFQIRNMTNPTNTCMSLTRLIELLIDIYSNEVHIYCKLLSIINITNFDL